MSDFCHKEFEESVYDFCQQITAKLNEVIDKHNSATSEIGSVLAAVLMVLVEKGIIEDKEMEQKIARFSARIDQMRAEVRERGQS